MNAAVQPSRDRRAERMALLLQLERRARAQPDVTGLGFLMVNDSRSLFDYQEGYFWQGDPARLRSASGLAEVEANAPFVLYLQRLVRHWRAEEWASKQRALTVADAPVEERADWSDYLPAHLLWMPLPGRDGSCQAGLLLCAEQAPARADQALLELLQDAYAHALASLGAPPTQRLLARLRRRPRRVVLGVAGALLVLALWPVQQSVLAPGEIVARDPAVLRAPLQAVVERILVQPNQTVQSGEPLVQLDRRELESRLESARQTLAAAEAQLRQARQQALYDERAKAGLAELTSRCDQARADSDYLQGNLDRTLILSPRDGVAIFDDPSDWVGRPVSLGERILQVADPHDARLEVQLPVADAIELPADAPIRLFLNSQPGSPLPARLERYGYRAAPQVDGSLAYRLQGRFETPDPRLRVGLKGTAKLYGQRTLLIGYLLRRPLAALRTHLGW
ncbi:MAG: hypothetical protein GAK43_01332 [Stenotrophomonas maltophilia]|nr:MAG: hypothetical protein GAK43_01332 [Stenotrophomonas maltophilia]